MRGLTLCILIAFCAICMPQATQAAETSAQLQIVSKPVSARVFINSQDRGYTPLPDSLVLRRGDRIEAYAPGFLSWQTIISDIPPETLVIELRRKTAQLVILTNQLNALGAEVRAHFADTDTTFVGFLSLDKGGLSCYLNVFVGKCKLEIVRPNYEPFVSDIFVSEKGEQMRVTLKQKPLVLDSPAIEGLRKLAENYRQDCAQLLNAALALEEDGSTNGHHTHLLDNNITLYLNEFKYYEDQVQKLEQMASQAGNWDADTYRSVAQIYAYKGILLGQRHRFSEAHALFQKARAMSPFIDQEPSPLKGAPTGHTLKDAMAYAESWFDQLGRVDIHLESLWMVDKELQSVPLRFERILSVPENSNSVLLETTQATMHDSLITLAQRTLQDSIQSGADAFSIYLPKGYYRFKDDKNLLVTTEFPVDTPISIQLQPRVHVWLPKKETASDTIEVRTVTKQGVGPLVEANQLTFGQVYDLLIHTKNYKRQQQRVVFYRQDAIEPLLSNVTAIPAQPGNDCLYFKDGSQKLHKQTWMQKKYIKYLLLPIGASVGLLAM